MDNKFDTDRFEERLSSGDLHLADLNKDPYQQFENWYQEAKGCQEIKFANAMALSTLDPEGYPDSRVVLLKHHSKERGFVFFSNLRSNKGRSILFLPRASFLFYWEPIDKQVRIKGKIYLVKPDFADEYFTTRSRDSQIGGWASHQSEPMEKESDLDQRIKHFEKCFEGEEVPRPPHWTGFRLIPHEFHFWKQRPNRLHDSFKYKYNSQSEQWELYRVYP